MAGPSRGRKTAARPDGQAVPARRARVVRRASVAHPASTADDRYRWVALANTTASVFMSALDSTTLVFNTAS
jgi:hypothetical protein